jgi:hypothetical protein
MNKLMHVSWMVAAAAVIGASSASAAPDESGRIVAKVPFDFVVGDARLPAGEYTITETVAGEGDVLSITARHGRQHAYLLTVPSSAVDTIARPELVFEKFEGNYFLARVRSTDGNGHDIGLTPSAMERDAAAADAVSE